MNLCLLHLVEQKNQIACFRTSRVDWLYRGQLTGGLDDILDVHLLSMRKVWFNLTKCYGTFRTALKALD